MQSTAIHPKRLNRAPRIMHTYDRHCVTSTHAHVLAAHTHGGHHVRSATPLRHMRRWATDPPPKHAEQPFNDWCGPSRNLSSPSAVGASGGHLEQSAQHAAKCGRRIC